MAGLEKHIVAAVDDDFRVRESIASLVESAGYTPLVYSSAEEFLQSGTLASTGCMITDVRMPGIDGLEVQRRVSRQRALKQGAAGFLYKPFDAVELLGKIERALGEPSGH
jgi:FixJ family two-component response regulator